MGAVLLAISGSSPEANSLQYAMDLCQRVKADLKILQIIQSKEVGTFLRRFKQVADKARYFFEGSMAAAAFAEAGEFDSARELMKEAEQNMRTLLSQQSGVSIQSKLVMSDGKNDEVIVNYVRENKDIIVTVYDLIMTEKQGVKSDRQIKKEVQALTRKLPIPIVVVPVAKET